MLLCVLTVDIGDGRSGVVNIHEDSEPRELAQLFVIDHDLDPEVVDELSSFIERNKAQAVETHLARQQLAAQQAAATASPRAHAAPVADARTWTDDGAQRRAATASSAASQDYQSRYDTGDRRYDTADGSEVIDPSFDSGDGLLDTWPEDGPVAPVAPAAPVAPLVSGAPVAARAAARSMPAAPVVPSPASQRAATTQSPANQQHGVRSPAATAASSASTATTAAAAPAFASPQRYAAATSPALAASRGSATRAAPAGAVAAAAAATATSSAQRQRQGFADIASASVGGGLLEYSMTSSASSHHSGTYAPAPAAAAAAAVAPALAASVRRGGSSLQHFDDYEVPVPTTTTQDDDGDTNGGQDEPLVDASADASAAGCVDSFDGSADASAIGGGGGPMDDVEAAEAAAEAEYEAMQRQYASLHKARSARRLGAVPPPSATGSSSGGVGGGGTMSSAASVVSVASSSFRRGGTTTGTGSVLGASTTSAASVRSAGARAPAARVAGSSSKASAHATSTAAPASGGRAAASAAVPSPHTSASAAKPSRTAGSAATASAATAATGHSLRGRAQPRPPTAPAGSGAPVTAVAVPTTQQSRLGRLAAPTVASAARVEETTAGRRQRSTSASSATGTGSAAAGGDAGGGASAALYDRLWRESEERTARIAAMAAQAEAAQQRHLQMERERLLALGQGHALLLAEQQQAGPFAGATAATAGPRLYVEGVAAAQRRAERAAALRAQRVEATEWVCPSCGSSNPGSTETCGATVKFGKRATVAAGGGGGVRGVWEAESAGAGLLQRVCGTERPARDFTPVISDFAHRVGEARSLDPESYRALQMERYHAERRRRAEAARRAEEEEVAGLSFKPQINARSDVIARDKAKKDAAAFAAALQAVVAAAAAGGDAATAAAALAAVAGGEEGADATELTVPRHELLYADAKKRQAIAAALEKVPAPWHGCTFQPDIGANAGTGAVGKAHAHAAGGGGQRSRSHSLGSAMAGDEEEARHDGSVASGAAGIASATDVFERLHKHAASRAEQQLRAVEEAAAAAARLQARGFVAGGRGRSRGYRTSGDDGGGSERDGSLDSRPTASDGGAPTSTSGGSFDVGAALYAAARASQAAKEEAVRMEEARAAAAAAQVHTSAGSAKLLAGMRQRALAGIFALLVQSTGGGMRAARGSVAPVSVGSDELTDDHDDESPPSGGRGGASGGHRLTPAAAASLLAAVPPAGGSGVPARGAVELASPTRQPHLRDASGGDEKRHLATPETLLDVTALDLSVLHPSLAAHVKKALATLRPATGSQVTFAAFCDALGSHLERVCGGPEVFLLARKHQQQQAAIASERDKRKRHVASTGEHGVAGDYDTNSGPTSRALSAGPTAVAGGRRRDRELASGDDGGSSFDAETAPFPAAADGSFGVIDARRRSSSAAAAGQRRVSAAGAADRRLSGAAYWQPSVGGPSGAHGDDEDAVGVAADGDFDQYYERAEPGQRTSGVDRPSFVPRINRRSAAMVEQRRASAAAVVAAAQRAQAAEDDFGADGAAMVSSPRTNGAGGPLSPRGLTSVVSPRDRAAAAAAAAAAATVVVNGAGDVISAPRTAPAAGAAPHAVLLGVHERLHKGAEGLAAKRWAADVEAARQQILLHPFKPVTAAAAAGGRTAAPAGSPPMGAGGRVPGGSGGDALGPLIPGDLVAQVQELRRRNADLAARARAMIARGLTIPAAAGGDTGSSATAATVVAAAVAASGDRRKSGAAGASGGGGADTAAVPAPAAAGEERTSQHHHLPPPPQSLLSPEAVAAAPRSRIPVRSPAGRRAQPAASGPGSGAEDYGYSPRPTGQWTVPPMAPPAAQQPQQQQQGHRSRSSSGERGGAPVAAAAGGPPTGRRLVGELSRMGLMDLEERIERILAVDPAEEARRWSVGRSSTGGGAVEADDDAHHE